MKQRVRLHINGIVQGVGFRPYLYNLSKKFRLGGFVFNNPQGVVAEVEGERKDISAYIKEMKNNPPPASSIATITQKSLARQGETTFCIRESRADKDAFTFISHDLSICEDCREELFSKNDRRYLYPFINCTNCGPRFTITKDVPYDRRVTTMDSFSLCAQCREEYNQPANRRFHAQPNACFSCGPGLALRRSVSLGTGNFSAPHRALLMKTAKLLYRGKIVAIKGIGGYHLGCDAKNISAVMRLREKKLRPAKPFAVMLDDLRTLKNICAITQEERKLLFSSRRPIVLLKIKRKTPWVEAVAPGQGYLGVMCAYAPLHYLIFHYLRAYTKSPVLVMTSGNAKDFPLAANERELARLKNYTDYSLVHNRPIHMRCDDSIVRIFAHKEIIIRSARGYTPEVMECANKENILACGAELKNTFSIVKNNHLIASPHIGDLKNYANYEYYLSALAHYKKIFNFEPHVVAYDYHSGYMSSEYALSLKDVKKIAVQHHHAHIAACLFENRIFEKVIGVCFDGTGLGMDNAVWGGEFFIADRKTFVRKGYFDYFGLLGSDKAIQEPARVTLYLLYALFRGRLFDTRMSFLEAFTKKEVDIFIRLIQNKTYTVTSSAGRLFDAASSLLGLKHKITYEAEAAILLEMLAMQYRGKAHSYPVVIKRMYNSYRIDWRPVFSAMARAYSCKEDSRLVAHAFHFTMAKIIQNMAQRLRNDSGINTVVLSGGVFQNCLLLALTAKLLKASRFSVAWHHRTPFNDGAISIGQAVVANENI
ncbi:MAG: carbamoyltransferase HypF [Candidatus Omnitrophota bacterium]